EGLAEVSRQAGKVINVLGTRETTYLDANLKLTDVDLALLVKQLELKLPFDVAGKLTVQVKIGFPINAPTDYKSYRLDGTARAAALDRLPGAAGLAHGLLTGDVKLRAPADKLTDPASYDATATLRSDRLEAYGVALTKASADLALKGGVARATSVQVELNGAP